MNNREVKTIKIILRTRSKYEEMKSTKGANSEFIIIRTKFSSVRHNYDYRNSWQYATPNSEFSMNNDDNFQR